jgi:hypothetical protein
MNQTPSTRNAARAGEYVVSTITTSATGIPAGLGSETRPGRKLLSKFGAMMLPFATAAAFTTPVWEGGVRTTFSRASRSESALYELVWAHDAWTYFEEPADLEQIRTLNRLLSLTAADGFFL